MNTSISQEQALLDTLERFIIKHVLDSSYIETAQKWFTDLAITIIEHQESAQRPIVVGVNGCQGSGKSTLSALLVDIINEVYDVPCIAFSIDDFYLSKQDRLNLAKNVNPLLATRGVPGTHDTSLLESVITDLLHEKTVQIPVFDKSIDDVKPTNEWMSVTQKPKIIILEGWCVGIDAQSSAELTTPVNEFEKTQDPSRSWRDYVNDMLSTDYNRIFSNIDYLIMLKAPSFKNVYTWRCEQEHKLIASLTANSEESGAQGKKPKKTMSDEEILNFIQFYQRLTEHALQTLPVKSDCVFMLNERRGISQCQ